MRHATKKLVGSDYYRLIIAKYDKIKHELGLIEVRENRGIVKYHNLDSYTQEIQGYCGSDEPLEIPVDLDDDGAARWREDNL